MNDGVMTDGGRETTKLKKIILELLHDEEVEYVELRARYALRVDNDQLNHVGYVQLNEYCTTVRKYLREIQDPELFNFGCE